MLLVAVNIKYSEFFVFFFFHSNTFKLAFKEGKMCAPLCEKEYKEGDDASLRKIRLLQKGMKLNYQHHW